MSERGRKKSVALTPQERSFLIQLGKAILDHTDREVLILSVPSRSRPTLRRAVAKLIERDRREREYETDADV